MERPPESRFNPNSENICVYVESATKPNWYFNVNQHSSVKELRKKVAASYQLDEEKTVLHGGLCCFYVMKDDSMVMDSRHLLAEYKSDITTRCLEATCRADLDESHKEKMKENLARMYFIANDKVKITSVQQQDEEVVIQTISFVITANTFVQSEKNSNQNKMTLSHGIEVKELRQEIAIGYEVEERKVKLISKNSVEMEKVMKDGTLIFDAEYQMEYFLVKYLKNFNCDPIRLNPLETLGNNESSRNEAWSECQFAFDKKDKEKILDFTISGFIEKLNSFVPTMEMFKLISTENNDPFTFMNSQNASVLSYLPMIFPSLGQILQNPLMQNFLLSGGAEQYYLQMLLNTCNDFVASDSFNFTLRSIKEEIDKLSPEMINTINQLINFEMVIGPLLPLLRVMGIELVEHFISKNKTVAEPTNCQSIQSIAVQTKYERIPSPPQTGYFISLSRQILKLLVVVGPKLLNIINLINYRSILERLHFIDFHEGGANQADLPNIVIRKLLKQMTDDDVVRFLCESIVEDQDPTIKEDTMRFLSDEEFMNSLESVNNLMLPKWDQRLLPKKHVSRKKLLNEIQSILISQLDPKIVLLHGSSGCGKTTLCWEVLQSSVIQNHFPGGVLILSSTECPIQMDLLNRIMRHICSIRPFDPTTFKSMQQSIRCSASSMLTERIKDILHKFYLPRFLIVIDDVNNSKIASKLMELPLHFLVTTQRSSIFNPQMIQIYNVFVPPQLTLHEEDELWSKLFSKNNFNFNSAEKQLCLKRSRVICGGSPILMNLFSSIKNWENLLRDQRTFAKSTSTVIRRYKFVFEKAVSCLVDEEKKKYFWFKMIPCNVNITAETMMILWQLPHKEEASIFLEKMFKKSLLQHGGFLKQQQQQQEPVYVLHSFQKVALQYCSDPIKEAAEYHGMVHDRIGRLCNRQWYKLSHSDSCLWTVLTNSLLYESQRDPQCLDELLDLRNINMMLKTMGLFSTIDFLQRACTGPLCKQLQQFLLKQGQYFSSLKFNGRTAGVYETVQIALMEAENSLLKIKALEILNNQDTNASRTFAFYWSPQRVSEGDLMNISYRFDDHIQGFYYSPKSTNIFIATRNGKIHCLSQTEEQSFQMPCDSHQTIVSLMEIGGLDSFVVIRKLRLGLSSQPMELNFYRPGDFDKKIFPKPYVRLEMDSENISSIVNHQQNNQTTMAFFIANQRNYAEFIIYEAIFRHYRLYGRPIPRYVYCNTDTQVLSIHVHLHSFEKHRVWNLWRVGKPTCEYYLLGIYDHVNYSNKMMKLNFPVNHVAFVKPNLVAILHLDQLIVYSYSNNGIKEEYGQSFSPGIATIEKLVELFSHNQYRIISSNHQQVYYVESSASGSMVHSLTHDDFAIKLSKFGFDNFPKTHGGIQQIILWQKLPIETNNEETFYCLVTIDDANRLHMQKVKLVTQSRQRKMIYLSDISFQFSSINYQCSSLAIPGDLSWIIATATNGVKKSICLLPQLSREPPIVPLFIDVNDEASSTGLQKSLYFSFLNRNMVVLGRRSYEIGVVLSQVNAEGQPQKDYELNLHEYTTEIIHCLFPEFPVCTMKLLDSCIPILISRSVLIRRIQIISAAQDNWVGNVTELYRLKWNEDQQIFQSDFCFLLIDRKSTDSWYFNDLQTCECERCFTFYFDSQVKVFKLPSMRILGNLDIDPYYNFHVSFRPHQKESGKNCVFAKLSALHSLLTVHSVDNNNYTVKQIGHAPFHFQKLQKPHLSWSQSGRYLYVKDEWKNTWTFEWNEERIINRNCLTFVNHISLSNMDGQCQMVSIDDDLVA